MYQRTLSYYIAMLYRSFADFTSDKLQEVGLNFGLLFFIVYIGKKPNWCCTIKVDIENSKGQYIEKDKQEATKDGSESTKIQHGI